MLDLISEEQFDELNDVKEEINEVVEEIKEYFKKDMLGMAITEISLEDLVKKYSDNISIINDSEKEMVLEFTMPSDESDDPIKINKIVNKDIILPYVEDSIIKVSDKFLILFKGSEFEGKRTVFSVTYSFNKNKKLIKLCIVETENDGEDTEKYLVPVLVKIIKGNKNISAKDFENMVIDINKPSDVLNDDQKILISSTSPKFDKIIAKNMNMTIGEFSKEILSISSTDLNYHRKINNLLMELYRSKNF